MKSSRRLVERTLLVIGIVCCGAWAYAWMDAHWFEMREGRRLDRALEARAVANSGLERAEKETFSSFSRAEGASATFAASAALPSEGDLIGRLTVDRLDVSALLLEGTAEPTLRRGVGRIPGTSSLTETGNVGIAGHRDSFFRGLKDVQTGDVVELQTLSGTWRYRVEWTKIVSPTDIDVLDPTDEPALTLVTCYPFHYVGSAPERFIVRAVRLT